MSDLAPLFLYEAVLCLYTADPSGEPTGDPLWWGAVANAMRIQMEYEEVLMASSGDPYQTAHHVDERHTIEIERTWLLPKNADPNAGFITDFRPRRNQKYVLEAIFQSGGVWYRRTFRNVTARSASWDSVGALQFGARQSWRAESFEDYGEYTPPPIYIPPGGGASGGGTSQPTPPVYTPLTPDVQEVGFFREAPFVVGEYLLGHYRWGRDVRLKSARLIGYAPQGSPAIVTLELGGSLQSSNLTLTPGTANTETSASIADLGLTVPSGTPVRWKITSGPTPPDAAWCAALAMEVQPL